MELTPIRVERLRTIDELNALKGEWNALVDRARLRLPFQTWEWNATWWEVFRADRFAVVDDLEVRTFRDARSGTLVAVAPLMRTSRPGRGPFRTRVLQFFGTDPNITEIRGLVCAPEDEGRVVRALCDDLWSRPRDWDWIRWDGIRLESEAVADIASAGPIRWGPDVSAFELSLPSTWEQLRARLSRNLKESLRKCYNSLKRDGHTFSLEVARTREEVEPALERFFHLHAQRANLCDGVRHEDVFEAPVSRRFMRALVGRLHARNLVRIFTICVDDKPAATRLAFATNDSLYLSYSGYDLAWAKYGVMTTCLSEAIRHAIGEGFATVNLSTGNDVSKARWRPAEHVYRRGVQSAPTLRGSIARSTYHLGVRYLGSGPLSHATRRLLTRQGDSRPSSG
jgi:CelD/BcsL family acetyltransferase involved in cellulose biosynthesis